MKKLVTSILASIVFLSSIFADFFDARFFEIKVDVPASVTNNTFMLADFLQEEVVIDFTKIAKDMPSQGFNVITVLDPSLGFNVNILGVHAGMSLGLETYGKVTWDKDFFSFAGLGNQLYEELNFTVSTEADLFLHLDTNAGFKVGNFHVGLTPTLFFPLVHLVTEDSGFTVSNDENGKLSLSVNQQAALYTFITVNDLINLRQFEWNKLFAAIGFDLGGTVSIPLNSTSTITGNIRIPMVPGHLKYRTSASYEWDLDKEIQSFTSEGLPSFNTNINFAPEEEVNFYINRPFKLDVLGEFTPVGNFFLLSTGLGFGVRNPFAKNQSEVEWYPEYYLGGTLRLLGLLSTGISTEYTDQIFKHSLSVKLNLRVVEVDAGVSFAGSSMATSFRGAGFAAFATVYCGF